MIIPMATVSSTASACKQEQLLPLVNYQKGLTMNSFFLRHEKDKVVVIMGATGTGKTKLAIDIAKHFQPAEVINSDKIQAYKGLDITTNKATEQERQGVPHHLLGTIDDPNTSFTALDFCRDTCTAVDSIVEKKGLPIIAGGSNSYLDALVNHHREFRLKYECCFLWVDVAVPVLHSSLRTRVDRMVKAGQVDEVREFFDPFGDYTKGIRRAIGVPEFDDFLRAEMNGESERVKKRLLEDAIARIKINNCVLANRQILKIQRLFMLWKRNMHRLDATEVFLRSCGEEAWEEHVFSNSLVILHNFLYNEARVRSGVKSAKNLITSSAPVVAMPAVVAATH